MEQNFQNHSRLVTGYHRVLSLLALLGVIAASINLVKTNGSPGVLSALLIFLLFLLLILVGYYARAFALKAQDRAIRAEENFRYYLLTGKTLPTELRMSQIISLRFASDAEFIALIPIVIKDKLRSKEIKSRIINWKADTYRV